MEILNLKEQQFITSERKMPSELLYLFKKEGYEPFIDFIKAYCILVVVFCHGFLYLKEIGYAFWGVQIPLFFIIQVFHCYKREPRKIKWDMILRRILFPFILIQLLIFGVFYLADKFETRKLLISTGIGGGGYGPGSYYPWIYIQMAILIPALRPILEKFSKWDALLFFIFISQALEFVLSFTDFPDYIYRLLCFRYIFLIWVGWIWAKDGLRINSKTLLASTFSLFMIIYLAYFYNDNEPWFYNTGWATHRWVCYFWVGFSFVWILYTLYVHLSKIIFVNKVVKSLASASYEIFLVQMAYYALIPKDIFHNVLLYSIWFAMAFVLSISGGMILYRIEKRLL